LADGSVRGCDPTPRCLEVSGGLLTPSRQLRYGPQVRISKWEDEVKHTTNGRRWTYPCRDGCTWRCAVRGLKLHNVTSTHLYLPLGSFSGLARLRPFSTRLSASRLPKGTVAPCLSSVASSASMLAEWETRHRWTHLLEWFRVEPGVGTSSSLSSILQKSTLSSRPSSTISCHHGDSISAGICLSQPHTMSVFGRVSKTGNLSVSILGLYCELMVTPAMTS